MPIRTRPNPGKRPVRPTQPTGGQKGNRVTPMTFTKERVNELMQKRIERSHQAFFNRYGVKGLNELDDLFGRAKAYDELTKKIEELTKNGSDLQTRYDELESQNRDLAKKYAFSSRNIRPELYGDIETYFKGKGLNITEETLNEELKTHPDWYNKAGTVTTLGAEPNTASDEITERQRAGQLLGVQL